MIVKSFLQILKIKDGVLEYYSFRPKAPSRDCLLSNLCQTIGFLEVKDTVSQWKSDVKKVLLQRDLWLWPLSSKMNPKRTHRSPTKFEELNLKKPLSSKQKGYRENKRKCSLNEWQQQGSRLRKLQLKPELPFMQGRDDQEGRTKSLESAAKSQRIIPWLQLET